MFDHQDGIRIGRQNGTSVDADALTGLEGALERTTACVDLSDNSEDGTGKSVVGMNSKAVQQGAVEGRAVARHNHRLGKHLAQGVGEVDRIRGEGPNEPVDKLENLIDTQH
jgi:hypothetical protein